MLNGVWGVLTAVRSAATTSVTDIVAADRHTHVMQPLSPAVFHILLALADGERHGYGIMQVVERDTDGSLKCGVACGAGRGGAARCRGVRGSGQEADTASSAGRSRATWMKTDDLAFRALSRISDTLLLIYPRPFRDQFGREMKLVFVSQSRDVCRSGGAWALVPFLSDHR